MINDPGQAVPARSPYRRIVKFVYDNTLRNMLRFVGGILLLYIAFIAFQNVFINGEYSLEQFLRQLILGLSQGSIYALIALGYTLVYGILFMINFAHGEVFMAGAYIGFFAIHAMDESGFLADQTLAAVLLTIFTGIVTSVIVATLLERIAYRPLRNAPRLVPLITAIGASVTIQHLFRQLFGASPRRYPDVHLYVLPDIFTDLEECRTVDGIELCQRGMDLIGGLYTVEVLGMTLRLRPMNFIVFFVSLILMAALWTFIQRTKTGKAMRAVAEDKDTARLMGINVDRTIVTTFVLGAAMAGAGGVMFALIPGNGQVAPEMGFLPGIKAFTAAVVGGIGNVPGAVFGGIFLGVVESVGPSLLGLDNQLKDVIAFGMLVFILIFRPTGIFGEVLSEKRA